MELKKSIDLRTSYFFSFSNQSFSIKYSTTLSVLLSILVSTDVSIIERHVVLS